MLAEYFEAGGPLMLVVFAAWVVVLAGVLDRLLYALGRVSRRPGRAIAALAREGRGAAARLALEAEAARAQRGLARIDAVSHLATSLGLFGTVLGLAQTFFARGDRLAIAAPDVLAAGLATALYTTVFGLAVFLFGQVFLIGFREWLASCEAGVERRLPGRIPAEGSRREEPR